MKLYGGMDLHSTNVVTRIIDEEDKVIYRKKEGCDFEGMSWGQVLQSSKLLLGKCIIARLDPVFSLYC